MGRTLTYWGGFYPMKAMDRWVINEQGRSLLVFYYQSPKQEQTALITWHSLQPVHVATMGALCVSVSE